MRDKGYKAPQFIECEQCGGLQFDENGRDCPACSGYGVGAFFSGHFLYWKAFLSRPNIILRRFKGILSFLVTAIALLGLSGGVISLVYWFWQTKGESGLDFWNYRDPLITYFWISALIALFIIYRLDLDRRKNFRIRRLNPGKKGIPDNWEDLKRFRRVHNVYSGLSENTHRVIEDAYLLALKYKNKQITPLHLMLAMLRSDDALAFFLRLGVSANTVKEKLEKQLSEGRGELKSGDTVFFSSSVKRIIITAFTDAYANGHNNLKPLNMIIPALDNDKTIKEIFIDMKTDRRKAINTKRWFEINNKQIENYKLYRKMARYKPKTAMDKAYTAVATPTLNSFGYDLTLAAKWGRLDICVGREKELDNIFDNFKAGANGMILVGPQGVGKKTIISGIAQEMVKEEGIPDYFKDKRLIELDAARLISGASPAQAEKRLLRVLDEANHAGNIILYIEDLENIIGISSGGEESLELSEVLANAIDRKYIMCFASASDSNYSKYVEGTSIGNTMDKIAVNEPQGDQAIHILESKVGMLESKYKSVFFSYGALDGAIKLSSKYIHDKYLPKKAIEILEKTAARISVSEKNKGKRNICSRNDVAKTLKEITNIPTQDIEKDEGEKLLNLEKEIHKSMIDQEEAVNMVADSLRRARVELREGKKPISSFLFMGPTGVGKTELAKTISRIYFGKEEYMTRLDMSEYQHQDSVKKMIGDSNGNKGYLTEAVRQKPFSLILLDEFEKANPKIFDLFLQVMDDGRLTDGEGRTIDFTNSIIIATSNAGSAYIQEQIKKGTAIEKIKNTLINERLNKILKPELINRFDGIVVFKPLSEGDVADIAKLMLKDIGKMLKEKGIIFKATDEGVRALAKEGYDPKFGARPLRRLLQKKIENQIAVKILSGEIERRDELIINEKGEINIKKGKDL